MKKLLTMTNDEKALVKAIAEAYLAVFIEYCSVTGPTMMVVAYVLWAAYSAGIELAWYPYNGPWLLATVIGLMVIGAIGLMVRVARSVWQRYNESVFFDDLRAVWPNWLK